MKVVVAILVIIVAGWLAFAGGLVYYIQAQSSEPLLTVPVKVEFALESGLAAFEDADCTISLSELEIVVEDWHGEGSFYVKNTGEVDLSLLAATGTTPGYNASVLPSEFSLAVGDSQLITVTVDIPEEYGKNPFSFEIIFLEQ